MTDAERQQIDRLLDGELPLVDQPAIQKLLKADAAAIEYFADRAMLMSDLRQSLKRHQFQRDAVATAMKESRQEKRQTRGLGFRWRPAQLGWAAGILLLLALGGLWMLTRSKQKPAVIADIVDCQGVTPANEWRAGSRVAMREINLAGGRMLLRLQNGVLLDLVGPLEANFVSATELQLVRGQATAEADPRTRNFVISTSSARVVDEGTRFGVAVSAANETDVVVFEGSVTVSDPRRHDPAQASQTRLVEGEALCVSDSSPPRRVRMIPLSSDARSLQGTTGVGPVIDVTDNISSGDVHRYYGIVSGGMGEGARLYTTGHTRTWHAMTGEMFPQELVGADVVCTFSADKRAADLQITLMINRPCDLYVFPDASAEIPSWVQRDFANTGLSLRSGPWSPRPGDDAYVTHAVWKRHISAAGVVVLGSPGRGTPSARPVMYGIAVKAIP